MNTLIAIGYILLAILIIGMLSSFSLWLTAKLKGYAFTCQLQWHKTGWILRPFSLGVYDTGWFTPRTFGDGTDDPRKPGHKIAPTAQKRSQQIGIDIVLLKIVFVCAISKDETR